MKRYMNSGVCGKMNYIDVFNMTKALVNNFKDEISFLTHDVAHWGMVVNLNKAQLVLNSVAYYERLIK